MSGENMRTSSLAEREEVEVSPYQDGNT